MDEPTIASSALKHGITREAIQHAFRNPIRACDVDDGFTMLIGPAPNADLLEIGVVNETDGSSSFTRCRRANASSIER